MKTLTRIMLIIALIIFGTTFIGCNNEEIEENTGNISKKLLHNNKEFARYDNRTERILYKIDKERLMRMIEVDYNLRYNKEIIVENIFVDDTPRDRAIPSYFCISLFDVNNATSINIAIHIQKKTEENGDVVYYALDYDRPKISCIAENCDYACEFNRDSKTKKIVGCRPCKSSKNGKCNALTEPTETADAWTVTSTITGVVAIIIMVICAIL